MGDDTYLTRLLHYCHVEQVIGKGARMKEHYTIRVGGHIGEAWSRWFDDLATEELEDGSTRLQGTLPDQAALHGLLNKIRDLGMKLLYVERLSDGVDAADGPSEIGSDGR